MTFETKRLLLKSYEHEFADVIYSVVSQAAIAKQGTAFEFAIFLKENPEKYIGNYGFVSISSSYQEAETACFIDENEWGKGFATEVASFMKNYGFQKLGLKRVYGHCMSRNPGFRKVMEKIGFHYERTLRHTVKKGDTFEDLDLLGMTRSDYEKMYGTIISC